MKSIKCIIWVLFLFLGNTFVCAQTSQEKEQFGDAAFADGDYYSASIYYGTLLSKDSTNKDLEYKYAESCRMFNDYIQAEKSYAIVHNSEKTSSYPLALFWLGWMKKSNGKYREAETIFNEYYTNHSSDKDYYSLKAFQEIEACRFAEKQMKDTLPVNITHLGENINSIYSEFAPAEFDESTLLYSTLRPFNDDENGFLLSNVYLSKVYISKKTDTEWPLGEEWKNGVNDQKSNNANVSVTSNRKRIYFTRCSSDKLNDLKCNIYVTELFHGKWKTPEKLNGLINMPGYSSSQPAISRIDSSGLEILYFSSNRPGGFGKNDIWYSMISNGKYSDPVNLGSFINSPGDEISPFYNNKTGKLFFSSDWQMGMGGFDIFSSKGTLNDWTTAKNIGFPLNTSYNDIYFTVNRNDSNGYFVSNRPGSYFIKGETCCNDIYSYEWQQLKPDEPAEADSLIVINDTVKYERSYILNEVLPLTLYFHNDIPGQNSWDTLTNINYKATLAAYVMMKNKYENEYAEGLTGNAALNAKEDIDEFFDRYVESGFEKLEQFSSWLLRELEKGKEMNIVVKGYCSPLTTTAYNINLAKRRINSLINYFKQYSNGALMPYMNSSLLKSGKLHIIPDPLGESLSNPFVSDNPNDMRLSVYSRAAALERKIQIVLYEQEDSIAFKLKQSDITFLNTKHDFGKVINGDKKTHSFVFKNTGSSPLIVTGVETSCGCTSADFPYYSLSPGAEGQINIVFDSKNESDIKNVTITVYTNTSRQKIELYISANVILNPSKTDTIPQQKKSFVKP